MITSFLAAVTSTILLGSSLDMTAIDAEVQSHMDEFTACYEEGLKRRPKLKGKIVTAFEIDPTGAVTGTTLKSSELKDEAVESCIDGIWSGMSFPSYARACPGNDCAIRITYPLHFRAK